MASERNYVRFYALLKKMPGADKQLLVHQHTHGRTDSLRELTSAEYRALCDDMERATGYDEVRRALRDELRTRRSIVLKLMQQLDIDTTDWDRVDAFCLNPRITGKLFCKLNIEELVALATKLRVIQRKGGLKIQENNDKPGTVSYVFIDMGRATKC
nr:MAG TPA: Protein of unknown function (DUF1018) [Caudoviricetes sp.]